MAAIELSDAEVVWKPVPSCPGVEASNFGALRRPDSGRILSQHLHKKGYYYAVVAGDRYRKRVSVLVCEAFQGPRPSDGHLALHNNGNSTDNRAFNLRWGTQQENRDDMARHGTILYGEKNHMARLTTDLVAKIRATFKPNTRRSDGYTQRQFAEEHGITQPLVSLVVRGEAWKHLP